MMERSYRRVILADSALVGPRRLETLCGFAEVDLRVTDRPLPEAIAVPVADSGVQVLLAPSPDPSAERAPALSGIT